MEIQAGAKPLAKCRVLYIGSAVSPAGPTGMASIQSPLNERLPSDVSSVQGIDAWLYAHDQGLQLQYIHDNNVVFFPVKQLYVCAAVRRNNDRFVELDSEEAATATSSPPVFALVMKRDNGVRECHGFICKSDQAALALVQSCQYAYKQQTPTYSQQTPTYNQQLAPAKTAPTISTLPHQQTVSVGPSSQASRQLDRVSNRNVVERIVYHTEPAKVPTIQLPSTAPQVIQQPIMPTPMPIAMPQVVQQLSALPSMPVSVGADRRVPEHGYFYTANEALIRNYNLEGPPKVSPKEKITVENIQTERSAPRTMYHPQPPPQIQRLVQQPLPPQQQVFQIEMPQLEQITEPMVMSPPLPQPPAPQPVLSAQPMAPPYMPPAAQPIFIVPPPPPSQNMVVEEWRTMSSSSSESSEDEREDIGQIVEEVMRRRSEQKKPRSRRGFGTRESETVYRTAAGYAGSSAIAGPGLPRYNTSGRGTYEKRPPAGYGFPRSDARIY